MFAATSEPAVLIELGAIILALALIARLVHRVGISPVPAYLLAGLVVGQNGLFRLDLSADFVSLGSEIGVVLLLLTLGLQFTADDLRAGLRDNAAAGVLDAIANFTPGLAAGLLLGWDLRAAMVLGGVTYISSSGIIAKSLADLGRLGNRETGPVLSLLVLEDLAMAGYLPVMAAVVAGASAMAMIASLTVAAVTATTVLFVALRHGSRVSRAVASESDEVLLLTVFGFTLLVAGVAHQAQVSAGVGAFLVGLALSGPVATRASQLIGPLPRSVRRHVLLLLRVADRRWATPCDPACCGGVGSGHCSDQGRHRLVGGTAGRRRPEGSGQGGDGVGRPWRVLGRDRRTRHRRRIGTAPRPARCRLRPDPGDLRTDADALARRTAPCHRAPNRDRHDRRTPDTDRRGDDHEDVINDLHRPCTARLRRRRFARL